MSATKEFKIKVDNNFKEASKDVDGLNDNLKATSTANASVSASGATATTQMNALGASKLTGLVSSVGGVVKALFTLRGALIATGIGAFVVLIASLKNAFTRSEEGQNKFSKLMGVIGSVVENVMDVLSRFGEAVISAVENPIESIKNFAKAIKENITNRFEGMLELIPALGKAVSELFSGNFSEAGEIATNAVAKVALGVEDLTGKIDDARKGLTAFIKEAERDARIAGVVADARAKADKIDRKLLVDRAKAQTKISELQLKSRQEEKFSEEQRMEFAKQALKRTDDLLAKEESALKLRFKAKRLENQLADSSKEDLDEQARLEAELINLQTRRLDAEKTATKFLNTLRDELTAKNNVRSKIEKKALALGLEFTKEVSNEELKARIDAKVKLDKETDEFNKKLIAKQKAQDALSIEVMDEGIAKETAKLMAKYDAQILLAEGNAELEKQLTEKLEKDITAIKEKEAEKQKAIDDKTTAEGIANQQKLNQQKVSMASDGFGVLADLVSSFEAKDKESAKRQFKVNKALQIGQTIASTASGIMQQLAVPQDALTGMNFVKAGIVATTGAASLVKIAGSKFDEGSTGGSSPEIASSGGSQAPNFNVVGNSGLSQLAQLQTEPTRAYVVSGEVTSQQALDRNREMNATL